MYLRDINAHGEAAEDRTASVAAQAVDELQTTLTRLRTIHGPASE
jgi:hypothetical protein